MSRAIVKEDGKDYEDLKAYFEVLNLPPNSTYYAITQAYHRLAKEFHPDKCGNGKPNHPDKTEEWCKKRFQDIGEAYNILKEKPHVYTSLDLLELVRLCGPTFKNCRKGVPDYVWEQIVNKEFPGATKEANENWKDRLWNLWISERDLDASLKTLFETYSNAPEDFWRLKVQRLFPGATKAHYQTWKERLLEMSLWCEECNTYHPYEDFEMIHTGEPIFSVEDDIMCTHCGKEHGSEWEAEFEGPLHREYGLDKSERYGPGSPWEQRGRKDIRKKLIERMEGSSDVADLIVDFLPLRRKFDLP